MAIIIKELDSNTFIYQGIAKSKGYRAIGREDNDTYISVIAQSANNDVLFTNYPSSEIIVQDSSGVVIIDGSTSTTIEVIQAINLIVNFSIGSGGGGFPIDPNYFFDNTAARDAYFVSNPSELVEGVNVAVKIGAGDYYIVQEYISSVWTDQFTGIRINDTIAPAIDDKTTEDFIPIKKGTGLENSPIKYNSSLDILESTKDFFAPVLLSDPGSIEIGDAIISSGGREITAKSSSTGNTAVFDLQLYDDNSFKKATVFDESQVATTEPIQNTEDTIVSGIRTNNFRYIIPADRQAMRIIFKPEAGVISAPFTVILRLQNINNAPSYKETIEPTSSDLTDLGGGIWKLKLDNPLMTDLGFDIYGTFEDISLLGGDGFTGPTTFGDPDNNNFFPWLQIVIIPVVRKDIATEGWVSDSYALIGEIGGLEEVTEGGNTGYRRADSIIDNHGDIGEKAVDLSTSLTPSTTLGATGDYSSSDNLGNTSSAQASHSEGVGTVASNEAAHSEGKITIASGDASHAEGEDTLASAHTSHSQNFNTIAAYDYQTAMGRYNENKSYNLVEVGNGTSSLSRSNAFEIDINGNANIILGAIYKSNDINILDGYATEDWVSEVALNPTWVEPHSIDPDITYGGFKSTGIIRKRILSTGIDAFFQSSASLPIPSAAAWTDWQNRETLIYNN